MTRGLDAFDYVWIAVRGSDERVIGHAVERKNFNDMARGLSLDAKSKKTLLHRNELQLLKMKHSGISSKHLVLEQAPPVQARYVEHVPRAEAHLRELQTHGIEVLRWASADETVDFLIGRHNGLKASLRTMAIASFMTYREFKATVKWVEVVCKLRTVPIMNQLEGCERFGMNRIDAFLERFSSIEKLTYFLQSDRKHLQELEAIETSGGGEIGPVCAMPLFSCLMSLHVLKGNSTRHSLTTTRSTSRQSARAIGDLTENRRGRTSNAARVQLAQPSQYHRIPLQNLGRRDAGSDARSAQAEVFVIDLTQE